VSTPPENVPARLTISGRLTAATLAPVWQQATHVLAANPDRPVIVDATGLEYADASGIALLFHLRTLSRKPGAEIAIRNLRPTLETIVTRFDPRLAHVTQRASSPAPLECIGQDVAQHMREASASVEFVGQAASALAASLLRRARVRWGDIIALIDAAGADALPVIALVGFLMGVIIAFEIGNVAQQFGAVLYTVNVVGIALVRELSPLMTAIVFAGRSGAAFAAEIGTRKINDELSALTTFGLDPVALLVVPRLIAPLIAVPLLTVLADMASLFGGALVMLRFDVSLTQFYYQILGNVPMSDVLIGVVKAAVFGVLIAAIGCRRGLGTGMGAAAVGLSTTHAVVTSIVMVVVVDGIFAVLLDRLGL
jgi:phospholipid/cholesterol/gamma-HCH transport system permease protein